MGTSLDALNAPSSLTQRRQAASNLPNFELPPPNNLQFTTHSNQKYPPFSAPGHPTTAAVSLGNLLTPPSNSATDSSASSTAAPNGTTPNSATAPVLPYTPTFFQTGSTPGFHTGLTPQPWQGNPLFPPRSMFSPGSSSLFRHNPNSPSAGEGTALPPPPYDLNNVPQYGAHFQMPSPTGAGLASHHVMSNSMIRPPSQQSHGGQPQGMSSRPPSAPALYTNMPPATNPPSGYPYSSHTPVSQSPHSANGIAPRHSPPMNQSQMPPHQSQSPFIRPPYPSYSLPAMPGPAMSNVNSPGSQMSMVGNVGGMLPVGFNSGYAANPQHMYGQERTQSPQQAAQNDRPFRCDSCPQSFHRNHDLKRHKRIHLAVKPFPCKHCDKSFSRKDALKVSRPFPCIMSTLIILQRHILVKGCGNRGSSDGAINDGVKSESGSDIVSESPVASVIT
jgi:Zinc finger, C2H2 type